MIDDIAHSQLDGFMASAIAYACVERRSEQARAISALLKSRMGMEQIVQQRASPRVANGDRKCFAFVDE
jgi:hypothetical protein